MMMILQPDYYPEDVTVLRLCKQHFPDLLSRYSITNDSDIDYQIPDTLFNLLIPYCKIRAGELRDDEIFLIRCQLAFLEL